MGLHLTVPCYLVLMLQYDINFVQRYRCVHLNKKYAGAVRT